MGEIEQGELSLLETRLREHVEMLADSIGERHLWRPAALSQARDYIRSVWFDQGWELGEQSYRARGQECSNLEIATPAVGNQPFYLVGAHYDTVPGSPGANDNGSGLAVLLELARLTAQHSPDVRLRFVAFVNEEPPFFLTPEQGSRVYARAARRRGEPIELMLALETLGYYSQTPGSQQYPPLFRRFYPDRGDFVALVSNWRSRRKMRALARAFRRASDFPLEHVATFSFIPGVAWSDHWSFWREGYRALMVTDTAFYRYPYYHSPLDTADRLDYQALARVTLGLFEALRGVLQQR